MSDEVPPRRSRRAVLAFALPTTLLVAGLAGFANPRTGADEIPRDAGIADFAQVALVLRHPRCLNCHPAGDVPRQTDQRVPHLMGVRRGADDHGELGMRCSTCHSSENVGPIPGAPTWALAPIEMAWEGLDDHQLAEALKDRKKNGDKSLTEIDRHLAEDPLVGWGWAPGEGRQPVPISRENFVAAFRRWVAIGAPSPPPGTGTPQGPGPSAALSPRDSSTPSPEGGQNATDGQR